jgi:hypothetical protein
LLNEFKNAKVFDRKNVDEIYKHILNIFSQWKAGSNHAPVILNEKYSRYNTTAQLASILKAKELK